MFDLFQLNFMLGSSLNSSGLNFVHIGAS